MKIQGYFNFVFDPRAPFIEAIISVNEIGLRAEIPFLIDTGASASLILDKDVVNLGIDVSQLKKSDKKMGGIGGSIETYIIENAEIVFPISKGRFHIEHINLYVGIHNLAKLDAEAKKKVMILPSLLGRDILNNYDFHILKDKNLVYLEKKFKKHR